MKAEHAQKAKMQGNEYPKSQNERNEGLKRVGQNLGKTYRVGMA